MCVLCRLTTLWEAYNLWLLLFVSVCGMYLCTCACIYVCKLHVYMIVCIRMYTVKYVQHDVQSCLLGYTAVMIPDDGGSTHL
jgi:hypothetical protein